MNALGRNKQSISDGDDVNNRDHVIQQEHQMSIVTDLIRICCRITTLRCKRQVLEGVHPMSTMPDRYLVFGVLSCVSPNSDEIQSKPCSSLQIKCLPRFSVSQSTKLPGCRVISLSVPRCSEADDINRIQIHNGFEHCQALHDAQRKQ